MNDDAKPVFLIGTGASINDQSALGPRAGQVDGENQVKVSMINLVDLAGSEKAFCPPTPPGSPKI